MVIKSIIFTTVLVGMTMGLHQAAKADNDDWNRGGPSFFFGFNAPPVYYAPRPPVYYAPPPPPVYYAPPPAYYAAPPAYWGGGHHDDDDEGDDD